MIKFLQILAVNLPLVGGQNIYSEAAQLEAKQRLALLAENDVVLGTASTSSDYAEYHHTKSGGAFGSSKKTTLDTYQDKTQVGTTLGGGEILVSAGNDLKAKNLQAVADKDLQLQAVNNVSISADTNYFKETHFEQKSKSGVFSGGGIGITFGKQSETHEREAEGWQQSQARSTLGSLSGNISVSAGNYAHLSGTDLIASKELDKAITIEGKSTYIGASEDELSSKERHEYKQSGLTIAFSSAVTDAAMAVQSSLKRSEQVKDERLSQLLKVKAANEAIETVQKASQAIDAIQKAGSVSEGLANSDAKISVSVGASKSVSTSHTQQTTHQGSELSAGSVSIRATEGDNTISGSKVDAKDVTLVGNNINLLATTDSQSNRSDNKSSSWSVGVFVGKSGGSTGFGVEGAVNVGKGYANSDSQVQNHTEINADRLTMKANETTTLEGATANVNHLALETKNLHIESVQDIEKYDSKQTQGGVKAAFAWGSGASGSAQFIRNKANVDYAQVNQQSGFNINESSNINVEENTHLKGGVINAQGDKANHNLTTGTLTTENIENRSDIKVSTISAGVSSDMTQMATMAMGAALSALGNMNESERSQTKAAISSNINLTITDSETQKQKTGKTAEETLASLNRDTANANQAVEKADLSAIQEKQETAQVIGQLSVSWTNRLVQPHLEEANKKRQEAEQLEKSDPLKSAQLKAEAQAIEAEYGLGSNLQMGIRAATAALQGLATGNANQAAVGLLSPYANKLIKEQTTNADGTVNTEANLMAHAVLGAIEAYATGNNAAAGALGALTAEAAAPYLMQALYKTDKAENLTDSQKQNIANLSQIAAGLAGGVTGDSTADFVSGAEIGKRAVENNAITPETVWDAANIAIGVSSLSYNISEGNYGSAAIDAAGLLYDGMATAFPFLPAGASAGIDAYRASNTIKQSIDIGNDVAKATNAAHKAAKNPNNIVNNPAVTGTKVHRATGDILGEGYGQATKLSDSASSYFRGANRTTGRQPDMSWSGTRMWADLTTPNQWNAHLRKYQSQYGEGIPILYKPHVGVVNSYKLHSGASVILNGGEAGYNILIKDSEEK